MNSKIYLDNNATTILAPEIFEALKEELNTPPSNPDSLHEYGREAKARLANARSSIANYLKVKPTEIIFTSGGTESMNLLIQGYCSHLQPGHIITSSIEHSCVQKTLAKLEEKGWKVSYLPASIKGCASPEQLELAIETNTHLIILSAANSETGVKHNYERSVPAFSSPIQLAHLLWEKLLGKDDIVIDATMGNGKDTLQIAKILSKYGSGRVIALDIQPKALENTLQLLKESVPEFLSNTQLLLTSHENFPIEIQPGSVKLIVYNLGYLPGGDKELTTQTKTTLLSIENALNLIVSGGALSITCYPGHPEGLKEHEAIKTFIKDLDPKKFSVSEHLWPARNLSPILILIQKK